VSQWQQGPTRSYQGKDVKVDGEPLLTDGHRHLFADSGRGAHHRFWPHQLSGFDVVQGRG
jgi:hypothetical protein